MKFPVRFARAKTFFSNDLILAHCAGSLMTLKGCPYICMAFKILISFYNHIKTIELVIDLITRRGLARVVTRMINVNGVKSRFVLPLGKKNLVQPKVTHDL